jgi:hypothetical protein
MRGPYVSSWMEQRSDLARAVIDSREVRSLISIAAVASPGEIIKFRGTTVLTGNDVLEVERFEWRQPIRKVTVLAAPAGAVADLLAESLSHLIRARTVAGARPLGAMWQ